MKKILLLTFVFLATATAFAQTNLALGKTAYASSVSDENDGFTADKAIDGDSNSKWASNYNTKEAPGYDDETKNAQWFYVDLGKSTTFNTIKMLVDNQPAKNFEIRVADEINTDDVKGSGQAVLQGLSSTDGDNTYPLEEAATGRYVIINFIERATIWGYGIYELGIYDIDYNNTVLTTFSVSPSFVLANKSTELTFTTKDQYDNELTGVEFKVIDGALQDNAITPASAGPVTLQAEYKGVTKEYTIYALDGAYAPAAPDEEKIVIPVYSNTKTDYNSTVAWMGDYDEKADVSQAELTLGDQVVKPIGEAGKLIIGNNKDPFNGWMVNFVPSANDVTTLHVDLFTVVDATGHFEFEWSEIANPQIATTAGEWTSFDLDVAEATTMHTITLKLDKINDVYPDVLVANVYFSNETPVKPEVLTVAIDDNGIHSISGYTTSADKLNELLTDPDVTVYDLRDVELDASITSLEVANPNAMLRVTDAQAEQLSGQKNLFKDNTNYFIPRARYEITDGYPVYTKNFISTSDDQVGFRYTRDIPAATYVTTSLPITYTLPEGISAYSFSEMTTEDDKAIYTFKRVEDNKLADNTPYILYSENGATLEIATADQLDFQRAGTVECGDLTFHANYETFTGDGSQYGLLNSTESIVLRPVKDGTIGAFRGYFTKNNPSASKAISFVFNNDNEANGITSVASDTVNASNVYTIDGRSVDTKGSVENLAKGIYIIGGKKVIVK